MTPMCLSFRYRFRAVIALIPLASVSLLGATPSASWFPGFRLGRAVTEVEAALRDDPSLARSRDEFGNTALHHAALFGDVALLRTLLAAGCDPNATNGAGATPIHYAVDDAEKVGTLLTAGSSPDLLTSRGSTPLLMATKRAGSAPVVRLLLAAGARVDVRDTDIGATPLVSAAYMNDTQTVRLLLDAGADPNLRLKPFELPGLKVPSPPPTNATGLDALMQAAYAGDDTMLGLLLARGFKANAYSTDVGTALHLAAYMGSVDATRVLLDAGADPNARDEGGRTPLMWAALDETGKPGVVELLLRRGARPNEIANEDDERPGWIRTAIGWARQRGDTPITRALERAGATNLVPREPLRIQRHAAPRWDTNTSRVIAGRSLDFLLRSDARFSTRRTCVSCHNQAMPALLIAPAGQQGIPADAAAVTHLVSRLTGYWTGRVDAMLEMNEGLPNTPIGGGYLAWALSSLGRGPDRLTDALTLYLAGIQRSDGSWRSLDLRPPQEGSHFTATALATRAIAVYGPPSRREEWNERVGRARTWLRRTHPVTTEDKAFRLLGLIWSGADASEVTDAAVALKGEQRPDGGWAQLEALGSDAYATGQVLWVLQEAKITTADPSIRRGLQYLIETEDEGAWRVTSRVFAFQPSMLGFRYGRDHWVSASATSWSAGAMLKAAEYPTREP